MNILKSRVVFYCISGIFVVASATSLLTRGLNLGVDFKGDSRLEVSFADSITRDTIVSSLAPLNLGDIQIDEKSDHLFAIRTKYLTEEEHQNVLTRLRDGRALEEKSFLSTGPSIGRQLRRNALIAIGVSLLAIIIYIAFVFRHVSRPVSSWIYGVIAIVALIHDVTIPTGIFSYMGYEIDAFFVSALLTVLGFSVHDTIVVFDRVREHLRKDAQSSFEEVVGRSLNETIVRSINTSLTTLFSLTAVYFFGGVSTQHLALALMIGIVVGTYSSIFIASPLLVTYAKWRGKER